MINKEELSIEHMARTPTRGSKRFKENHSFVIFVVVLVPHLNSIFCLRSIANAMKQINL